MKISTGNVVLLSCDVALPGRQIIVLMLLVMKDRSQGILLPAGGSSVVMCTCFEMSGSSDGKSPYFVPSEKQMQLESGSMHQSSTTTSRGRRWILYMSQCRQEGTAPLTGAS